MSTAIRLVWNDLANTSYEDFLSLPSDTLYVTLVDCSQILERVWQRSMIQL